MTALIIVLCILGLLCFLLFMPVGIKIRYDGDFNIRATYLFFRYTILPEKEKKPPKKKKSASGKRKKQKPKKETSSFSDLIKEKGIRGLIIFLKEIIKQLKGAGGYFTDHLVISKLNLSVSVSADNAADTAVHYGYACAGIYPLISSIQALVKKCKKPNIEVTPNFDQTKTLVFAEFKVSVKLVFLFAISFRYGYKTLMLFIKAGDPEPKP